MAVLSFRHDDTTTIMRQIVSWQISVSYDAAKTAATFGELNFDELDIMELVIQMEERHSLSVSATKSSRPLVAKMTGKRSRCCVSRN